MSIASYNWNTNLSNNEKIKICISNRLNVLIPHSQYELELMYFYKNQGCKYLCNGKLYDLQSGELAVMNSGEMHGCNDWGKGCEAVCVIIDLNKMHIPSFKNIKFENKISAHDEVADIFTELKKILTEKGENQAETECMVNSIIYRLLGFLAKNHQTDTKQDNIREIDGVIKYISDNLSEKITVDSLAEIMHLSSDRFYHIFKEKMGVSPIRYITEKRILMACELLKNTDFSISRIATEFHFCTSSYFSEQFFKFMQMTPSCYRKQRENDDLHL